jgi:hypothetical protein
MPQGPILHAWARQARKRIQNQKRTPKERSCTRRRIRCYIENPSLDPNLFEKEVSEC